MEPWEAIDASGNTRTAASREAMREEQLRAMREAAMAAADVEGRFYSDHPALGFAHEAVTKPLFEGLEYLQENTVRPITRPWVELARRGSQAVADAVPGDDIGSQLVRAVADTPHQAAYMTQEYVFDPLMVGGAALKGGKALAKNAPEALRAAKEAAEGLKAGYKASPLASEAGAVFPRQRMNMNAPTADIYAAARNANEPAGREMLAFMSDQGATDQQFSAARDYLKSIHDPYKMSEANEAMFRMSKQKGKALRDASIVKFGTRGLEDTGGKYMMGVGETPVVPLGEHLGFAQYGMVHELPKAGVGGEADEVYRRLRDIDLAKAEDTMGGLVKGMDESAYAMPWYDQIETLESIGKSMGMPRGWASSPHRIKDESPEAQKMWMAFQNKIGTVGPSSNNASVVVENAKSSAALQALKATEAKFGPLEGKTGAEAERIRDYFKKVQLDIETSAKAAYKERAGLPKTKGGEKGFGFESDNYDNFLNSVFAGTRYPGSVGGDQEKILSYAGNRFGNRMTNTADRHDVRLSTSILYKLADELDDPGLRKALDAMSQKTPTKGKPGKFEEPAGSKAVADLFAKKSRDYMVGLGDSLPPGLAQARGMRGLGLSDLQAARWVGKERIANNLGLFDPFEPGTGLGKVVSDTSEKTGATWTDIMRNQIAEALRVPPGHPSVDEALAAANTGGMAVPPPLAALSKENLHKEALAKAKALSKKKGGKK